MTATAHTLIAGAIAAHIQNPYLAGILSLGSHFVVDSIPHWDLGTNWKMRPKWATGVYAISENLIGITVAYFLYAQKVSPVPLLIIICLSVLPDWMESPWYIFYAPKDTTSPSENDGIARKLTYSIYKIENYFHTKTTNMILGILTQIFTVLFFTLLLH
jgi:hypothetical protein